MSNVNWECRGCSKNCKQDPKDYYMLKDKLWLEINGQDAGMLCMDCVEERLGRKLQAGDIHVCTLTASINPYTKNILYESMPYEDISKLVAFGTTNDEDIIEMLRNGDRTGF